MITAKRLNIRDKSGYFFMNMTNVNDFNVKLLLINKFTMFENRSTIFEINYFEENNTSHTVFNDI